MTPNGKGLPKFVTKKWIEVYDQLGGNYNANKDIRIKTSLLRSDLCDFSDVYIVVKWSVTVDGTADVNKRNKIVAFKNNALFINCISKINGVQIDNAEDLDLVMPMYNLIEYSKNCRKTTGSSWNYYRDEPSNALSSDSESLKYKTRITEKSPDNNHVLENVEFIVPLKHLSNFWRSLDMPLINCEIELILTWPKSCVLDDMTRKNANPWANPPVVAILAPSGAEFQITDTKLYVPVVTLSKENDKKLLGQLKSGFQRTVKWNKYRSQMTIQPQNNNLNYLTDPTFPKVNRLFVLSFERNAEGDHRNSFSRYYIPNIEIKHFHVLIDGKSFVDLPVKMKKKHSRKLLSWVEIIATQPVIYWILFISKKITNTFI